MASDTVPAARRSLGEHRDRDRDRGHDGDPDHDRARSSHVPSPAPSPLPPSAATAALLAIVLAASAGALLQLAVPCARCAAPFVGAAFAVLYASIAGAVPRPLRRALGAHDAFATILAALAAICALGTLVVQGQGEPFYRVTYGPALAAGILRLGLDDLFHSLWFAALAGVFAGSIVRSAARRWPPSRGSVGFHLSHLGLLVALGGAAASSALAVRGRIDLHAGEAAREVRPATAHRSHDAPARPVPLGFALRLDRFEVERYASGLRVGYYERQGDGWKLRASFEPEVGVLHRLPSGASFHVRTLLGASLPGAVLRLTDEEGGVSDVPLLSGSGSHLVARGAGALVLEPRPAEPRSFRSMVTATGPSGERSGAAAVNAPFRHGGWTFYQASYDPADPRFSALEAVRDPGAAWFFAGLVAVAAGVARALLAAAWLRRPRRAWEAP